MKLDTSSYYPKSPLDDDNEQFENESATVEGSPDSNCNTSERDQSASQPLTEPMNEPDMPKTEIESGIDSVCSFLSWILVPLLMPVYGIILIFNLSILDYVPFASKLGFTLIVAGFNLALPAAIVLVLKKIGLVQDVGLNGRKERLIPYIISILCLGATSWYLSLKGFPLWAVMFFAGGAVAGIIELLINFRWKISVHAAGIAGVVALLIRMLHDGYPQPQIITWLIVFIALSGIVGSARLWLRRHTLGQVLAGYTVGFCSVYLMTMMH